MDAQQAYDKLIESGYTPYEAGRAIRVIYDDPWFRKTKPVVGQEVYVSSTYEVRPVKVIEVFENGTISVDDYHMPDMSQRIRVIDLWYDALPNSLL